MELFDKKFVHFMWDDSLKGKLCFFENDMGDIISLVNERSSVRNYVSDSEDTDFPFCPKDKSCGYRFAYYDPNYEEKVAYKEGKLIQNRKIGEEQWHEGTPIWQDDWEYRVKPEDFKFYCGLSKDGEDAFTYDTTTEGYKYIYAEFDNNEDATEWCKEHDKFAAVARAWENGKTIQLKNPVEAEWLDIVNPCWGTQYEYRVKPDKRRMTNRELAKWLAEGKGQLLLKSGDNMTQHTYCGNDNTFVPDNWKIRAWDSDKWIEPEVKA